MPKGPKFPAKRAKRPHVVPGKGGHDLGTLSGCESKRAHGNVKGY